MNWNLKFLYCYSAFMAAGAIFALSHGNVTGAAWDVFCLACVWRIAQARPGPDPIKCHLWP